jgi:hypothetical protein
MTVATTKIVNAVSAKCALAMVDIDFTANRPEVDAPSPGFGRAVNIRLVNVSMRPFEGQSMMQCTGTLQFDCYAEATDTKTIDVVNQETHAGIIAALWDDGDPTLDGMVDDLEPSDSDPSEQDIADAGWSPIQFAVTWFTPRGNAAVIIGRNGVQF